MTMIKKKREWNYTAIFLNDDDRKYHIVPNKEFQVKTVNEMRSKDVFKPFRMSSWESSVIYCRDENDVAQRRKFLYH